MKYKEVIEIIKLNNEKEYIAFNIFKKKNDFYFETYVISSYFDEFYGNEYDFIITLSYEGGYMFDQSFGEEANYIIYVSKGNLNEFIETGLQREFRDLCLNDAKSLFYFSGDIFEGGVCNLTGVGEYVLRSMFNDLPCEFDIMTEKDKLIFYKKAKDELYKLEVDNS